MQSWRDVREGISGKESRPVFFSPDRLSFRWTGLVDLSTSCRDHRPPAWDVVTRASSDGRTCAAAGRPDSRMYRRIRGKPPTVRPISRITSPRRGVLRLIAIELQHSRLRARYGFHQRAGSLAFKHGLNCRSMPFGTALRGGT